MQRMKPAAPEDLAAQAEMLASLEAALGFVPEARRVMARHPEMTRAWADLMSTVYREPGTVPVPLRCLIAHTVSRSAGCMYSMAHTALACADAGVPAAKVQAVFDCRTSPLFDEAERAALVIARGAGANPNVVSDADFDAMRPHFGDAQIVEIVAVIALFGFLNRWQATLALTLEDEPRAFAEAHLAPIGWTIGRHG